MSYWLGIDVGSTVTTAALCREQAGQQAQLEVISLGARSAAVPSVVYLGPDGEVVVGEAAERRAATDPDRVVRDVTRHALLVRWVVDLVVQHEGVAAQGITLTHPAGWTAGDIQAVADALAAAELPMVRFCSGAEAAAAGYSVRERSAVGATIAVYDLGGGTFEVAVIRKTGAGSFATLGVPERIERLGGTAFDDAVFGHVRTAVPALRELESGATETARFKRSLALCQRDCTEAKEALSVQTEVTIPVLLPQVQTQVCLSRAEFEDLIRPQVHQTVEALRRTLRSAGLDPAELDAVLLIGGSSRVPLVAQLLSAELGRSVAVDADPQVMIALGAAVSGLATATAYSADLGSAGLGSASIDSAGLATVGFDRAGSDTAGLGSAMAIPTTAGTTGLAGPGGPEPVQTELPPWLTASPPEAAPVEVQPGVVQWQQQSPRRIPRFAAAGLLGLVLLAGAVSVPFIMSANRAPVPAVPAPPPPALQAPAPRLPAEAPEDQNPVVSNPVTPDPAVSNPVVSDPLAPAPAVPDPNAATTGPGVATPAEPAKPPTGSRAATPNNGSRPASRPKPPAATPSPPPPPPPPRNVPDWVETARS